MSHFFFTNPLDDMEMSFATLEQAREKAQTYLATEDSMCEPVQSITIFAARKVETVRIAQGQEGKE